MCRRIRSSNAQVVRKAATDRVIERNAAVQLCYVEVDEPDMHKPLGDLDRLKVMLEKDWGWKDLLIAPHLIPQIQGILRKGNWGVTAAIHRDMDSSRPFIVGLWPGLKNEAYGVACDIGSTTIAMHLVSLLSGPHRRLFGHIQSADPLRRRPDEPRLLCDDEPGWPGKP